MKIDSCKLNEAVILFSCLMFMTVSGWLSGYRVRLSHGRS